MSKIIKTKPLKTLKKPTKQLGVRPNKMKVSKKPNKITGKLIQGKTIKKV
jgi:hypothetical protein